MTARLKLYTNFAKFQDSSVIDCENEELMIKFEGLQKGLDYIVCLEQQGKKLELMIKNYQITIPKEFTRLGEILIKILALKNGLILKEYGCDKLLVKKVNDGKYFIPEIEEYKRKVENCQNELIKIQGNIETLTKLVSELYGVKIKLGGNE